MAKSEQELSSLLDAIIEKKTQSSESKVRRNSVCELPSFRLLISSLLAWPASQQIIYTLVYASRLSGTEKADKRELGGTACRVSSLSVASFCNKRTFHLS